MVHNDDGHLLSGIRCGRTVKSFTYDDANRISSSGYDYDARGNLTADPARRFVYDGANRLTAVIDASTETTLATYAYDFLNRRTSVSEGTQTVFFHYDGASPNVIAETDEAGETIATFAHDDLGQLHSMTRDGSTYYYHANHRGDVVAITGAAGDIVNTYTYDPCGSPLTADEGVKNPYRYAGYRFDETTGLYYLWNRYYDAETCRFLTRDVWPGELESPLSMNAYLYCLGDPVNWVDPSGLCGESVDPWDELDPLGQAALGIAWADALAASGLLIGLGAKLTASGIATVATGAGVVPGLIMTGLGLTLMAGGVALAGATLWSMNQMMPSRFERARRNLGLG
ncbi:MAG: RHS repeat-associated core domain-containing protein [Coriobacteriia bacterium]|nr:RHS repeat-associated core domain-containing protein [Coriobacteriia bacterium]